MKTFILSNIWFLLLLCFLINEYALCQDNSGLCGYLKSRILEESINPDDQQQVIDSLDASDLYLRNLLLQYCAECKISAAKPKLLEMLQRYPDFNNADDHYIPKIELRRTLILRALVALEDTSIHVSLKSAIDSLKDENASASMISEFAGYLMKTFNDDFGWVTMKSYFQPGSKIWIPDTFLEPFLNSSRSAEVVSILNYILTTSENAISRWSAICMMGKVNSADVTSTIYSFAINDSSGAVRNAARSALKRKGELVLYTQALNQSVGSENDDPGLTYEAMIASGQIALYIRVVNLYTGNTVPKDSLNMLYPLGNYNLYVQDDSLIINNLDTLKSALQYFSANSWIRGNDLVGELSVYLDQAKTFWIQNDSSGTVSSIDSFRSRLVNIFCDTTVLLGHFLRFGGNWLHNAPGDSLVPQNLRINKWALNYLYNVAIVVKMKLLHNWKIEKLIESDPSSLTVANLEAAVIMKGNWFYPGNDLFVNGYDCYFKIVSDSTAVIHIPSDLLQKAQKIKISCISPVTEFENHYYLTVKPQMHKLSPALTLPGAGSFTIEVPGKGFTPNSKVLWNDSARVTTFVSDSLLRAVVLEQDVAVAGTYRVSVLCGDSLDVLSDSLLFKVVTKLPKPIRLLEESIANNWDDTYMVCFGYLNVNTESVYIPVGSRNQFTPGDADRGQTTLFLPGRQKYAFCAQINAGETVTWNLLDRKAKIKIPSTASRKKSMNK